MHMVSFFSKFQNNRKLFLAEETNICFISNEKVFVVTVDAIESGITSWMCRTDNKTGFRAVHPRSLGYGISTRSL